VQLSCVEAGGNNSLIDWPLGAWAAVAALLHSDPASFDSGHQKVALAHFP
jgi:hypothetical protein